MFNIFPFGFIYKAFILSPQVNENQQAHTTCLQICPVFIYDYFTALPCFSDVLGFSHSPDISNTLLSQPKKMKFQQACQQ